MEPIPAAGINGVDISVIAGKNPEAAEKIAAIAAKMNFGHETDDEFIQLCGLLHQFDFGHVGKGLLRANSDGNDQAFEMLERLYPDCQVTYDTAVDAFERQYEVALVFDHQERAFCRVYRFVRERSPQIDPESDVVTKTEYEVQITMEPDGLIVGDAYTLDGAWAVPLKFGGVEWSVDEQ